jgi:hypothetical protein
LTNPFVDEEDRVTARWSFHPGLPASIVHLPIAVGFSMMVHASNLTFFVSFEVDVALDGDGLGLEEQVRVDLLADFDRELLEVAGVRRAAGMELIDHFCGIQAVSSDVYSIQMVVRLMRVVSQ